MEEVIKFDVMKIDYMIYFKSYTKAWDGCTKNTFFEILYNFF